MPRNSSDYSALGRRELLQLVGLGLLESALLSCGEPLGDPARLADSGAMRGNFRVVFSDVDARARFKSFLENVFHLYPEDAFHELIAEAAKESSDQAAYGRIAEALPELSPSFSALRYALPALHKQKAVMTAQTQRLLGGRTRISGYLEIGSDGRYLSGLEDVLDVEGPIYTSTQVAPSHGLEAMVDRGRIGTYGKHIPMADYRPLSGIAAGSLDLVTVYIGFHHCPLERRERYIGSIRDALSPQGILILRDHDVPDARMDHFVALAHDVFNVGTGQSWNVNAGELRHFYPLSFITGFLEQLGFKKLPGELRQDGDPTHNTLMAFAKA